MEPSSISLDLFDGTLFWTYGSFRVEFRRLFRRRVVLRWTKDGSTWEEKTDPLDWDSLSRWRRLLDVPLEAQESLDHALKEYHDMLTTRYVNADGMWRAKIGNEVISVQRFGDQEVTVANAPEGRAILLNIYKDYIQKEADRIAHRSDLESTSPKVANDQKARAEMAYNKPLKAWLHSLFDSHGN